MTAVTKRHLRIYPDTLDRHISTVLAGAYELEARGEISLEFSRRLRRARGATGPHLLWCELEQDRKIVTICFDMADWPWIASYDALASADVYFKRSFDAAIVNRIAGDHAAKVRPFGFYMPCRSRHAHSVPRLIFQRALTDPARSLRPARLVNETLRPLARHAATLLRPKAIEHSYPLLEEVECSAETVAEARVLFQARIWDPELHRSTFGARIEEINYQRIELASHLKARIGDRFIGGIVQDSYSAGVCPDLLATSSTQPHQYLRLMQRNAITVTSMGLHGSVGAKLPEYFASSRCVVTDRLVYDTVKPPAPGIECVVYDNPKNCADLCEELLETPERVALLRQAASEYYLREVRPNQTIGRCLDQAISGG